MSAISPALNMLAAQIGGLTAAFGCAVDVAAMNVTDRAGDIALALPSLVSPNGACRLVPTATDWIAVNLARDEDRDLVPAWLRCTVDGDLWQAVERGARARAAEDLVADAVLLGLPVARVGEITAGSLEPALLPLGAGAPEKSRLNVVDLSALWAGPLCGAIFAAMGASVLRVESTSRPDPGASATPGLFARLNAATTPLRLDFRRDQQALRERVLAADVVITSARPRALLSLGLAPETMFAANPGLVWVAITGYGWTGAGAGRVAFGDDAAAAGGLVRHTAQGPRFLGDALADPITGLAAAAGALRALKVGGGMLVDAAMARCAAGAATLLGLEDAA